MTPAKPLDIFGLHQPLAAPPGHAWWPYALVAVAVAAVATLVIAVRRRRRRVPPDLAALRTLEAARELIARGQPAAFSAQVSGAVRDYVELAFGVRAPRRTTEELLADLMQDAGPIAAHRAELGAFLSYCDLAKFARFALSEPQMTGMLDSAEAFVRATAGGAS